MSGFMIISKDPHANLVDLIDIARDENVLERVDRDHQNHMESADGYPEDEFCPAYDPFGYPASLEFP